MAKRGGPSISVKMILTTTVLIVVTGVGAGLLNIVNIRRAFDDASQRRVALFQQARTQIGQLGTPLFARATEALILERGRDKDILALVQNAVREDTRTEDGRKDYVLRHAYVLDLNQKVIAQCHEDEKLDCKLFDNHEAVSPALGPVTAESWPKVLAAWQAAAASGGSALVELSLDLGKAPYRVFAYPVFFGEPATAAGAIAAEAPAARQGYVVLGYDMTPVRWFAVEANGQKAAAVTKAALYTAAVGALFALIGTVLAILLGLSVSKPIKQLAWKAEALARGDLEARVEVTSGDEIGVLGENFNFMADQIEILLEQTAEKARIDQELEVAKTIQETLVPSPEPVTRGTLRFAGYYQPAAQTGGDWWTWSELPNGKILIVIGDVTGHGVPAAIITAAAKAACDVARHVNQANLTVTTLLELMNQAIFESGQQRFHMTCFASIVDPQQRTITYANAGHNFPYLFRAGDGKGEFGSLMIRGNRLGDARDSRYEAKTTELAPGDVLVWYTDGLIECEGPGGEEYGERRFRASVKKAASLDPADMRDALIADASGFFGDVPRRDDITLVVGRIQ